MGNKSKQGPVHCSVGDAFYKLGDFEQALHNHELYLKSIQEGDGTGEGHAYGCLGKDHHGLGNFKDALCFHEKQLEIALEIRDKAEEGRAQENLGNTYYSINDFDSAIERYKEALCIAEELGDKAEIRNANRKLGNSYYYNGASEHANVHHSRDLDMAKELGDNEGEGIAFGNLGNVYFSFEDFQKARECHEKSLNIAKESGNSAEVGKASYALGCTFESLGSLNQALNWFRCSLKTFDDTQILGQSKDEWKINVQHEHNLVIVALCRTLLKQNKFVEALSIAEKGRAQALADRMKSTYKNKSSQSGSDGKEDVAPEMAAAQKMDNEDHSSNTHYEFVPGPFALEGKEDVTSPNLLSCPPSTTLFLAIDKKEINIWVLKGNSVHFRKCGIGEKYLKEDVTLSFDSLTRAAYPGTEEGLMKKALRTLYDIVINPVEDLLAGDELIIVPDGPLCAAPFGAFIDPHSRYLYESFRIRVIPSLTSLKLILGATEYHSTKGALLVGNPCLAEIVTQHPWNWNLPNAEKEVKVIGEILKSEPLIGKDATREEVLSRLTSVALVHIAAQGSDDNGEILLTPNLTRESQEPKEEDYVLTMVDITALQLRARLVVLNCCHSAQGKIKAEGAVGIARGFLAAGARCVLVSLWEINDEVTLNFMKCFYEQLVAGKKASEALNYAMKNLKELQDFDYVKDWAGFQLIGDDVTLNFVEEE